MCETPRSKSRGQKLWYQVKGLVIRNTHVQYKSPISSGLRLRLKFFKSRSNFKVKVTRSKIMVPCERSCHKEYKCAIWKPYLFWFESYGQGESFSKVGQTSRSRSQGQKLWYQVKGLVIRNTHVKYKSSIFIGFKVMVKVKVFVYAANGDANGRAMTLAPRTFVAAR